MLFHEEHGGSDDLVGASTDIITYIKVDQIHALYFLLVLFKSYFLSRYSNQLSTCLQDGLVNFREPFFFGRAE